MVPSGVEFNAQQVFCHPVDLYASTTAQDALQVVAQTGSRVVGHLDATPEQLSYTKKVLVIVVGIRYVDELFVVTVCIVIQPL